MHTGINTCKQLLIEDTLHVRINKSERIKTKQSENRDTEKWKEKKIEEKEYNIF